MNALLSYVFLFLFGNICILISTVGVLQAYLFLLKQKQIARLLTRREVQQQFSPPSQLDNGGKCNSKKRTISFSFRWQSLVRFTVLEVKHVLLFNGMNDTYGSAFLTFLLINVPLSVRLLTLLMLRQLSGGIAGFFFVLMYFLHQMSAIFGMHLVATR